MFTSWVDSWLSGFWFAVGAASIWLLATIGGSIARSITSAGSVGMIRMTRVALGWYMHRKGDQSNIINVTLHSVRRNYLMVDTLVSDRVLSDVWDNQYHCMRLRTMAKFTTDENPVIRFVNKKGVDIPRAQNLKVDDYAITYSALINLIAEKTTNTGSMGYACGLPVEEHRFVVALTYEKHCDKRAQHFRVMVILEEELLNFPEGDIEIPTPQMASRIHTLRCIAEQYKKHPERFGILRFYL